MEVVFYVETDKSCHDPIKPDVFDCHICQVKYFNHPDIEYHYLTEHKNIIILYKDSNKKISIKRPFVGPKSKRPKKRRMSNDTDGASTPIHLPLVPMEQILPGLEDVDLTSGWDLESLGMMMNPTEDILQLLEQSDKLIDTLGLPLNCDEIAAELIKTKTPVNTAHSESKHSDIKVKKVDTFQSQSKPYTDVVENTLQSPSELDTETLVADTPQLNNSDSECKQTESISSTTLTDDLDIDLNLDEVLEFALYLEREAAKAAMNKEVFDLF